MENAIWEYFKNYFWLIFGVAGMTMFLVFYQLSSLNSYKQQVNYQIERKGGLTEEAVMELNNYSKTHYNGVFSIESDSLNKKSNFGEIVDYDVVATVKVIAFSKDLEVTFEGSGVSLVR